MTNDILIEEYKGFVIEKETDPWPIKYKQFVRFRRKDEWEGMRRAGSVEEARAEIDELTYDKECEILNP